MGMRGIHEAIIPDLLYQGSEVTFRTGVQIERDQAAALHGRGGSPVAAELPTHEAAVVFDVIAPRLRHSRVFRHSFRRADG